MWTPHRPWMSSQRDGWLPPGWAIQERTRQKQRSFLRLGPYLSLSPYSTGHTDQPWRSMWGNYTRAWILGGENHWGPSWRLAPANPIQYLHNISCSAFFFSVYIYIYISISTAYPLLVLGSICYSKDINSEKLKAIWTFNFSENMSTHLKLSNFSVTAPLFYLKELKSEKLQFKQCPLVS